MFWFLIIAGGLHLLFMAAELFPWGVPLLLGVASKKLPANEPFTPAQGKLVATVVHNAGIYNGIVAGGLFLAAIRGESAMDLAMVMLIGAVVAGLFGAVTLRSPVPAIQAIVGVVGLILVFGQGA